MSKRLLVIEDSKSIAAVIGKMASSLGFDITYATSFAEVKALIGNDEKFFCATVDYSLPDALNGEVIPFVIQNDIPSIVMTGHMDDTIHKKILNLPIIDYVTKENSQAFHYLLRVLNGQLENSKISVLVVDDSITAGNHVAQLLTRRNFTVFKADDSRTALQVLNEHPEIKMAIIQERPHMNGVELTQNIRKSLVSEDLIIIGISGADRNFQAARFIKSGANDFLKKPFCQEEFYCRVMHNIEKLKYIEEIKATANNDYLTGLFNRRHFVDRSTHLIENLNHANNSYMFIVLQIDRFKKINDYYGYATGDQTLLELAELLIEHFKGDLIARLGGAEFGLLIASKDVYNIESRLKAVLNIVQEKTIKLEKTYS